MDNQWRAFFILVVTVETLLVPGLHANTVVFEQQPASDAAGTIHQPAAAEDEEIREMRRKAEEGDAAAQAVGEYREDTADELRQSFEDARDSLLHQVSAADRDAAQLRAKGWLRQFENDDPPGWPLSSDPTLLP